MRIIADRNMPFAAEAFGTLGETDIRDGRHLNADDVRDADALAIRSTTRVNAALLDGSRVRFVGTATIGTDHMDIPYLEGHGIGWCYSPGCNANSVAEYIVAALLHLSVHHGVMLEGRTLGVIGVGHVGRRVVRNAAALGMRVLRNDPPRERRESECGAPPGEPSGWVGLGDLLEASDVVTVHVPMTREGPDRTFHLADAAFFNRMRPGSVFINAARGAVVDSPALAAALDAGRPAHAVLDTWEGEPDYSEPLLTRTTLATPHIAGHSFEGKAAGTEKVYQSMCEAFGRRPEWSLDGRFPPPPVPVAEADVRGRSVEEALQAVVRQVYDIAADDARFRARAPEDACAAHFDHLRRHYPVRREFRFTRAVCDGADARLAGRFRALGFQPGEGAMLNNG